MRKILSLILGLIMIISLTSCQYFVVEKPSPQNETQLQEHDADAENTDSSSIPNQDDIKSTIIYFGDSNGMGLNEEQRELSKVTSETLVGELIKGPQDPDNTQTIPDGTRLLSHETKNNIVYLNFSKEFKDNHWGGSTGESITIFSIVNTLALNPNLDIEKVQILVEGESIDTLAGHFDISQPLEPDLKMSKLK